MGPVSVCVDGKKCGVLVSSAMYKFAIERKVRSTNWLFIPLMLRGRGSICHKWGWNAGNAKAKMFVVKNSEAEHMHSKNDDM